ncbi:DUF1398 domain-containing protein [Solitalea koreensis]|uniref:Uncharacterized conserved protein YbcV, DUF1398 family n=1 Tax=Solitalea koreensis TaxID=543615 RepID=A0A521E594_9SPHI|nr:DUF1398 family protein [Solitalea koreensis]SMO79045.1 Uncharacterized conserved protein YbcV, DUF1398 family [Solitalea koreensis]
MFTIDQIKEAHSKVKTGADFPSYVQNLIKLGVIHYSTHVEDGHTEYVGENNYRVQSNSSYPTLNIAEKSELEKFKDNLKNHQQGETDYFTFCRQSAALGVDKWIVDMIQMTCTYYDKIGDVMLVEEIPKP